MIYDVEDLASIKEELVGLLIQNKEETGAYGPDVPLAPDWSKYFALDKAGILHIITVRTEERKLIGYYVAIVTRHIHYPIMVSDCDTVFILPEYRGSASLGLFKWVENYMKEYGVKGLTFSITPVVDFRGLADYLGFKLMQYTYMKRID